MAAWFAEAVRSELAALEKTGNAQIFEVLSGALQATVGAQAIYEFVVTDAARIPEDAGGRLKVGDQEYSASVIGQEADRIRVLVNIRTPPSTLPRALLLVDDTALLRKLAEVLESMAASPAGISRLTTVIFHPSTATVGTAHLPDDHHLASLSEEVLGAIAQARGSSITYVWGPPGTGKTTFIAHLVASLINAGERALVMSHTNTAVDQALYSTVTTNGSPGPLAENALVSDGKIVRLGPTTDPRVPDSVRFDKILDAKAREMQARILELEAQVQPLLEQIIECRDALAKWRRLEDARERLARCASAEQGLEAHQSRTQALLARAQADVDDRRTELARAKRAWFRRAVKVQRATHALSAAEASVSAALVELERIGGELYGIRQRRAELEADVANVQTSCKDLPAAHVLEEQRAAIQAQVTPLEEQIRRLQEMVGELSRAIIREARALFCTLTKNYIGKDLEGERFDAVVVDEISMALPPLLFLAAARATTRVILVGDFLQLPPIIRSGDDGISSERLRADAFGLAGVAEDNKPVKGVRVLTALKTQRRMAPAIADVARHIVYRGAGLALEDHETVRTRSVPAWLDFLPVNPLVIVDTADLHCWSGKQVGSLSRFNFYSATVAVELAAMAAGHLSEPPLQGARPIAIIAPYAAQRRLLSRLLEALELTKWVAAGTVHTFQGSQAALVIFDSVLDEPYWSARLSNPHQRSDVLRQLNVAVTRAMFKFVFVGPSEWLNLHAKPASGLGQLWEFLKVRADLVSAVELITHGFAQRVAQAATERPGWTLPLSTDGQPRHEVLDETTFFPRFKADLSAARESIFGLVPYFGEFRWPMIEPLIRAARERKVEVTLVTPSLSEVVNSAYVNAVTEALRAIGVVVISSSGLHGKDVIIDGRIHYTGSLNWASHRGRAEVMHRTEHQAIARMTLEFLQAKHIRAAAMHEDGTPRTCPECGGAVHVVNQRIQPRFDLRQALKIGCARYQETRCKYLRDIDERAAFRVPPRCQVDGRTKYRRVRRGRGEVWQCPKHPKECDTFRVVPGDP